MKSRWPGAAMTEKLSEQLDELAEGDDTAVAGLVETVTAALEKVAIPVVISGVGARYGPSPMPTPAPTPIPTNFTNSTNATACQLGTGEEVKCSELPNKDGEGCDYYQMMTWDCTACHNCPGGWINDDGKRMLMSIEDATVASMEPRLDGDSIAISIDVDTLFDNPSAVLSVCYGLEKLGSLRYAPVVKEKWIISSQEWSGIEVTSNPATYLGDSGPGKIVLVAPEAQCGYDPACYPAPDGVEVLDPIFNCSASEKLYFPVYASKAQTVRFASVFPVGFRAVAPGRR